MPNNNKGSLHNNVMLEGGWVGGTLKT